MPSQQLPAGTHYAVTWGIPANYAGMTSAMLHRSRAFVRLTGAEVTVVTYEYSDDYPEIRERLRDRGEMVEGMHLLNIWEDLRTWDNAKLHRADGTFVEGAEKTFKPLGEQRGPAQRMRSVLLDEQGAINQVDYFREDGSLLLSHRRQVSGPKATSVTLCDTSGRPIGTWQAIWALYHFWLDTLPRDPVAWFIVDSKTSANHFTRYQRPDIVSMHLVHGSHMAAGQEPPYGELNADRKRALDNINKWDAIVFLTKQQLDDANLLVAPGANRYVCPNGRDFPASPPALDRASHNGAMLASLTKRKRVSHAIKAINLASDQRGVMRRIRKQPKLDIYGDGNRRPLLDTLLAKFDPGPDVTMHGHVDGAAKHLEQASFSLLTSRSEGLGLVLIESMAAGCIPISYDIPYGPSDIITDGVNGYLVEAGKIGELADRVKTVARSSPKQLAPMRLAAYRRAQDFNDENVTATWAEIMANALDAKTTTTKS